ncbi:hemoglobin type 2 [Biomphalaria pfeifferi]|uniref:Globin n=1 Tax=Biomphalaria pfeifferi TaxID=112525 RepID=A0AAD8AVT2_BIOPF|nr:hemoglobin type 2 [Biomphalaria pfeifferi]
METKENEVSVDNLHRCPVSKLTKRERELLVESWEHIQLHDKELRTTTNVSLLLWLLENIPNMRARLEVKVPKTLPFPELLANEMFIIHSKALFDSLDRFVSLSDDPVKLEQKMRSIAKMHVNLVPSVGMEYFRKLETNFDDFIAGSLKTTIADERVQIWGQFLGAFCHFIEEEEKKHNPNSEKTHCCVIL